MNTIRHLNNSRFSLSGMARREVALVVAAIATMLAIAIPYVYRQRIRSQRQTCEARQFRASVGLIQHAIDQQHLPGYRIVQSPDKYGVRQPSSWAYAILPYVHPLDVDLTTLAGDDYLGQPMQVGWTYDRTTQRGPVAEFGPYEETYRNHGPQGEMDIRGTTPSLYIPEFICPADRPDSLDSPGPLNSFVTNCGMPDVNAIGFPSDWRENGVFSNQFHFGSEEISERVMTPPMTLQYIENHDGLANVVLLAENVDAGRWTDTDEAQVGFVWTSRNTDAPSELFQELWAVNEFAGKGDGSMQSARPSSYHIDGFNVAFCNGATRFIRKEIDPLVWAWMMMCDSENPRYPGCDLAVGEPYKRERPPIPGGSLPRPSDEDESGQLGSSTSDDWSTENESTSIQDQDGEETTNDPALGDNNASH